MWKKVLCHLIHVVSEILDYKPLFVNVVFSPGSPHIKSSVGIWAALIGGQHTLNRDEPKWFSVTGLFFLLKFTAFFRVWSRTKVRLFQTSITSLKSNSNCPLDFWWPKINSLYLQFLLNSVQFDIRIIEHLTVTSKFVFLSLFGQPQVKDHLTPAHLVSSWCVDM